MKKALLRLILTSCFTMVALLVSADTVGGLCGIDGDNMVSWTLDRDNGLLTISGHGAMADYDDPSQTPWYSYSKSIVHLAVEEGVTHISQAGFWQMPYLESAEIATTVTSIGDNAFYGAPLVKIQPMGWLGDLDGNLLPEGLKTLGSYALSETQLDNLILPASLETVGQAAFAYSTKLQELTCLGTVPPTSGRATLFECNKLFAIHVPDDAVATYKAAGGWATYADIIYPANQQVNNPNDDPSSLGMPYSTYVSDLGKTSALIICSLPDGAIGWDLQYRRVTADDEQEMRWVAFGNLTTRSYTIENLKPGTNYVARMRAVFSEQSASEWTRALPFTTLGENAEERENKQELAFTEYKEVKKAECDAMAMPEIDDKYCALLIDQAKQAIDALAFDKDKTFDENLAALDAITTQLGLALAVHRGSLYTFTKWQPSDTDYYPLDIPGVSGQNTMKTLRTADGKTIHTWLRQVPGVNWNDPAFGYYLHLQIFDAEGKALFGNEGLLISERPTPTYTTDYGLALAPNGDILIAYNDSRDDATKTNRSVYVYRYNQQGQTVWSADGVKMTAKVTHAAGSEYAPSLCVSGDNIYLSMMHSEVYKEKANENNWQPDPEFPDEPMPEYVEVGYMDLQVVRLNDDGTPVWSDNVVQPCMMMLLLPAPEGNAYMIYNNATYGMEAQRINKDGQNVWNAPVTVEAEALTPGNFMPTPLYAFDDEGGLALAYRKLTAWGGYEVFNHLSPDGKVFPQAVLGNGSTDGDAGSDVLAVRGQLAYVVWELKTAARTLHTNLFKLDGSYAWEGGKSEGVAIDALSMWAFRPVKIIPQADGWVVFYGNAVEWNAAKFIVCKVNDEGKILWSKQLAEGDFRSSGFSIVNDEKYAYIFFTRDEEYNEDGNVIAGSGGMFVMCVDISNAGNDPTGIQETVVRRQETGVYDLQGRKVLSAQPNSQFSDFNSQLRKGIYIQNGKKYIVK